MKRSTRILLVTALLAIPALSARADFVDQEVGARAQAMGGAFTAMGGDPASIFWNPAAILAPERRVQVEGMRTRLYDGVDGLTEDWLGLSAQLGPRLAVGAGWTRTGLEDLYHEDVITGAAAYDLLAGKLAVGASVLFYGASAPGYEALNDPNYLGAQWEPSLSLGAWLRPAGTWYFGASLENLLRPEIQLVGTSTDVQKIGGRRRLSAAYLLEEVVWLSFELRHHDYPEYVDGDWTFHLGAETWFQQTLALRAGVDDGNLTAGAGLVVSLIRVDLSLITHERLGNTYRAAALLRF
jgi:hypothetical protein